jgi:hypothetical protein
MKRMILTGLAAAAALALSAGAGAAKSHFSVRSVKGTYASTSHGTIDDTGTLVADGAGNIIGGTQTANDGTNICTGSLTGSYTVNPDGTGTLTIIFTTDPSAPNVGFCPTVPATSHAAMVLVSENQIEVSGTDPSLLESGSLTRQSDGDEHEHHHDHR